MMISPHYVKRPESSTPTPQTTFSPRAACLLALFLSNSSASSSANEVNTQYLILGFLISFTKAIEHNICPSQDHQARSGCLRILFEHYEEITLLPNKSLCSSLLAFLAIGASHSGPVRMVFVNPLSFYRRCLQFQTYQMSRRSDVLWRQCRQVMSQIGSTISIQFSYSQIQKPQLTLTMIAPLARSMPK